MNIKKNGYIKFRDDYISVHQITNLSILEIIHTAIGQTTDIKKLSRNEITLQLAINRFLIGVYLYGIIQFINNPNLPISKVKTIEFTTNRRMYDFISSYYECSEESIIQSSNSSNWMSTVIVNIDTETLKNNHGLINRIMKKIKDDYTRLTTIVKKIKKCNDKEVIEYIENL